MHETLKILVVDNELAQREVIGLALKGKYSVATAKGAEEALRYMADNSVDLVLLDIEMPGINGITALEEIKKRHPETEVVMVTACATVETVRQAFRLGAFGFLAKPFDIIELIEIVDKALKDRQQSKSLLDLT